MVLQASGVMSIPATVSVNNQPPASWTTHYNCSDGNVLSLLTEPNIPASSTIPVQILGYWFRLSLISGDFSGRLIIYSSSHFWSYQVISCLHRGLCTDSKSDSRLSRNHVQYFYLHILQYVTECSSVNIRFTAAKTSCSTAYSILCFGCWSLHVMLECWNHLYQRSTSLLLENHYPAEFRSYFITKQTWTSQSRSSELLENHRYVCWSRLEINFAGL